MRIIIATVGVARRHAVLVIAAFLVLAGLGLNYARQNLGIDTNTDHLFASTLPWRQAQIKQDKNFPQFNKLIVAVVRGATPEEARETASALNTALNADKTNFIDSSYLAGSPFLTREGLLLLPVNDLAKLLTSIVSAQPFLGQLAADPSARGLFTGLGLIAKGVQAGADITPYNSALAQVAANLQAAAHGHPQPLSWQSLIGGGAGDGDVELVLAHPKLDQGALQPGGVATAALMRIAHTLPDVKAGRVSVHYTGQIPISDEEFASLTQGMVVGGIVSVALIALWLYLALRSWRLILPILLTLLMGLVLTISFAAVTVRVMNLISVAFAILFIGLAVDFAIQFCVRLRDVRRSVPEIDQAMSQTARQAGGQIALAAAATACGFLAFAPTSFLGVAELGEIAGAGMLIALICTLTFLPALLHIFRPRAERAPVGLPYGAAADDFLHRHKRLVLGGFAALAIAGMFAGVALKFDANPLHTKDPNTESMRTLRTLMNNSQTNPFYAETLAPDLAAARALSQKLSALPEVAQVISGASFVPQDQTQKLAMLAQAQTILAPTLQAASTPPATSATAAQIRTAMTKARAEILAVQEKLPKNSPLREIATTLKQLEGANDALIMAMNGGITRFLPRELVQLDTSLSPQPISVQSLPPALRAAWFLPDGQVRVAAYPAGNLEQNTKSMRRFAQAVLHVAPQAGGPAISTIATAATIISAFQEAAFLSALAITVILLLVFRNLRDTVLVLFTLALSALLTALFAWMAGLSINYANIIALPLLLGVGVSFNVYFVMNFRAGIDRFLSSATAHAVLFSALTTGTAFGALAFSADRGTASMGELLLLSLVAVLIATFLFLPALLYLLEDAANARKT